MPAITKLDVVTPEMWVVVCTKKIGTTLRHAEHVQVFGPYSDMIVAEENATAWHRRDGWSCYARRVYPRETKMSLLQPTKIGAY